MVLSVQKKTLVIQYLQSNIYPVLKKLAVNKDLEKNKSGYQVQDGKYKNVFRN